MKFWLPATVATMVLMGCANKATLVPQVQQGVDGKGAKTVTVAPESSLCSRPQCPTFAAAWSSAKEGQAVLTIGLPHQTAEVTGAEFRFGSSEVVRVTSRSQVAPLRRADAGNIPATAFDVPLRTIERMAYASNTWVRVFTTAGSFDETIYSGAERSRAYEAMNYFLSSVQAVSGKAPVDGGPKGGLLDRLGGGSESK